MVIISVKYSNILNNNIENPESIPSVKNIFPNQQKRRNISLFYLPLKQFPTHLTSRKQYPVFEKAYMISLVLHCIDMIFLNNARYAINCL